MVFVSVDVSKEKLDYYVSASKKHKVIPNTLLGIKKLVTHLKKHGPCKVFMESTGLYQRLVHKLCEQVGHTVYVCNPQRVKFYSRSNTWLAKTDKIDACVLSEYGMHFHEKLRPSLSKSGTRGD